MAVGAATKVAERTLRVGGGGKIGGGGGGQQTPLLFNVPRVPNHGMLGLALLVAQTSRLQFRPALPVARLVALPLGLCKEVKTNRR